MSCYAFDASKTQTALVYAISGPPFEAFGEPLSSKLAPEILDPSAVCLFLPSLRFTVSCYAFDASKTQTALVYAISGPPFKAFGEPLSSKLAPEILDPNAV